MLNNVQVNFDPSSLLLLNVILAVMMFGVALSLRRADFVRILKRPVAPLVGLLAQFIVLPAFTALWTWYFQVDAQLALGMILVAACPGGTFSNLMTYLARGSVAVSVSMTAVSSLAATVLTPFNFMFYGNLNPATRPLIEAIALSPGRLLLLVVLVLAVPLALGMTLSHYYPRLRERADTPFRYFSLLVLLAFTAVAFSGNTDVFLDHLDAFAGWVVAHNALALLIGATSARLARLPAADRKAVTLEVGIQNSGLGLSILFTFFPGYGGTLVIVAFWGIWHLVSGLALSLWWSRHQTTPLPTPPDRAWRGS